MACEAKAKRFMILCASKHLVHLLIYTVVSIIAQHVNDHQQVNCSQSSLNCQHFIRILVFYLVNLQNELL